MALVGNERFVFAFACHRITPNIRNAFHTTFATLSAFYFSCYYQAARQPVWQLDASLAWPTLSALEHAHTRIPTRTRKDNILSRAHTWTRTYASMSFATLQGN